MRVAQNKFLIVLGCWLGGLCLTGRTQTPPPSPEMVNPQLQLMLSQVPVDITSPVTATATFDPPVVRVGEPAVYRVTFDALEASLRWPENIPAPAGLQMIPGARGQTMQMLGNRYRPLTAVNFRAQSARPGLFTMPAFWVEVYGKPVLVPEARLEAMEEVAAEHEPARQLFLEPAGTNLFVGERMRVRVLAPGSRSNVVEALAALQFNGDGFFMDKSSVRQSIEQLAVNGRTVSAFIAEAEVTPLAAGEQRLAVQAFTSGARFNGQVVIQGQTTIPGRTGPAVLLDSEPVTLQVRPLPGPAAAGFTGFIGNAMVDPPRLSTDTVRVGDPLKLFVTLRSDVNLARLVPPPPPPRVAGWQIFPAVPAEPPAPTPPAVPPMIHTTTFAYTLIPMTEEPRLTPAIPFSIFDPKRAAYVNLPIPGVALTIIAEGLPVESSAPLWSAAKATGRATKSSLSALAASPGKTLAHLGPRQMQKWFLLVQLLPAFVLAGLWNWDRRARFLAAHPEIVRRRQALRALRRERRTLGRAAASEDAPGFIRSGVTALQIVAAPHYPAEPRALVCGEVLGLFNESEQAGRTGEVIRQFFARQTAASFAPTHKEPVSHFGSASGFSLSAPEGGEGWGEEASLFPNQILSPQPSPRVGGERESEPEFGRGLFALRPELERILQQLEARL